MKNKYHLQTDKQSDIDKEWEEIWADSGIKTPKDLFSNPLFEEGYAIYRRYLPPGTFSLLELGTGSGRYGIKIALDNPDSTVVLTDTVETSIVAIKKILKEIDCQNVSLEVEDACKLSYADETFDVVFADGVIQHIIEIDTAMSEMVRVLKPGGRLILSAVNTKNPPHRMYKWWLQFRGKKYEYNYEHTYTKTELVKLFRKQTKLTKVTSDGFHPAYGVYRWGYKVRIFKLVSKILNRLTKITDRVFGRIVSRNYGFILFAVGYKEDNN